MKVQMKRPRRIETQPGEDVKSGLVGTGGDEFGGL